MEYGNEIIQHTSLYETAKPQELVNLMKALLNYGAKSQLLFDYKTDYLANSGNEIDDSYVLNYDMDKYKDIPSGSLSARASISLETNIIVNLYVNGITQEDNYHIYVDDKEEEFRYLNDTRGYFQKNSEGWGNMDKLNDYVIKNNNGEICKQIKYGVMSYCANNYKKTNTTGGVTRAIIILFEAYNDYFN